MPKTTKKFKMPPQFDWEADEFLKKSFQLLEEAENYDLFQEESRPRLFKEELLRWVERWKRYL